MTDYVKSTNFASKDALSTGNPLKIVKGTEIDTEFNNIATAVATKADLNSPTFIGTPAAPTAVSGTNTTQVATTAFVKTAIDNYDAALTVSTAQIEDLAVTTAKLADTAVTTAKIADSNITSDKIANASITTAKIADDNITPAKLSQPLTMGTPVASTSGTSIDFNNIPSWVKRITVMWAGVSTNGTSNVIVQIGSSGGIKTSGYVGAGTSFAAAGATLAMSTGFLTSVDTQAAQTRNGSSVLTLLSNNTWTYTSVLGNPGATVGILWAGGHADLGATLDRIRITTVDGTDTFDAGSINILYE